jgi:predicted CXXCH cytochrome family protein
MVRQSSIFAQPNKDCRRQTRRKNMKKLSQGLGALAIIALFAGASKAALPTAHDFTSGGFAAASGPAQACITCHAPHNANREALIWARADTTVTYTVRGDGIGTGVQDNWTTIKSGEAGLCLSCHDGQTAINGTGMSGSAVFGTDGLQKSHPVGITYDESGSNAADLDVQATAEGALGLGAGDLDKVSCASCHDPHEGTNAKMTRVAADICTQCHLK